MWWWLLIDVNRHRRHPGKQRQIAILRIKPGVISIDARDAGHEKQQAISGRSCQKKSPAPLEFPDVRLGLDQVIKHLQLLLCDRCRRVEEAERLDNPNAAVVPMHKVQCPKSKVQSPKHVSDFETFTY